MGSQTIRHPLLLSNGTFRKLRMALPVLITVFGLWLGRAAPSPVEAAPHAAPLQQQACTLPATVTTADELYDCITLANDNDYSGPTADTITLGADIDLTALTTSPLPEITSTITLEGAGYAIDGGSSVRIFYNRGNLTINQAMLQNGSATGGSILANYGGGILNSGGALVVSNSTLSGNTASLQGGGIYNSGGALVVSNSTFASNAANSGGGINNFGTLTVSNSTFSNNSASASGGGIFNFSVGPLTMTNSTFSGNSAPTGGAIFNNGTAHLAGNIFAAGSSGDNCVNGSGITINDNDYNLSDDTTCTDGGTGSATNATLNLGALADNGGPTLTHLPGAGSDAIGAISNGITIDNNGATLACDQSTTDQRGESRPINSGDDCTAGAVEVAPICPSWTVTTADELYDCITLANANESPSPTADTITLGTAITLTTGRLPQIATAITLEGAGFFIDGGGSRRIFDVGRTGDLTVNEATLQNGSAFEGGGIYSLGALTVTNSTLSRNSADYGGGIYNLGALTVTNSTFSGNSARFGGGIINRNVLTVTGSTFSGNLATSGVGGGIDSQGTAAVTNSTFSSNSAALAGGGIFSQNTVTVTNSTFFGNSATSGGGAVYGDQITMTNSLLTGTTAGGNCVDVTADASNIADDATCGSATQKTVGEINLDTTLADNGGPTLTHALLAGSHAIDFDPSASCLGDPVQGIDQRGEPRNVDGEGSASANECDAGAYEYQQARLTIAKATDPSGGTDFSFTIDPGAYSFDFKWGANGGDGSSGSGDGQFSVPTGVAVDAAGNVYVADFLNNRIQKFDSSGVFMLMWGWDVVANNAETGFEVCTPADTCQEGSPGSGDGQFRGPTGMAVDTAGNVYVADYANDRIQKFDSNGVYLTQWGSGGSGDGEFRDPRGVAVDAAGKVYVADTTNNRIQKFDSSGVYLDQWGSSGSGNGEFNLPWGVTADAFGSVYVADTNNNRIQKFDSSGGFITTWGTNGSGDGEFNEPRGLAVDTAGNVYVADYANDRIQKFDSNGVYLTQWGSDGSGDGQFFFPFGVSVTAAGQVYVVDSYNQRIQVFSPDLSTTLNDGESDSFDLPPGDYLVSELVPEGWVVGSIDCGDGIVTVQTSVEVALALGDDITCTFNNGLALADLTATKSNDTNGQVSVFSTFNWTITIANEGDVPATFSDGQLIFKDELPGTAEYGTVSIGSINNITNDGNIACGVSADVLTCSASGGEVTLNANGSFAVTVPTTPTSGPTLENPAGAGVCAADPDGLVAESDEANNSCSDSVTVRGKAYTFTKIVSGGSASPNDFTLNIGDIPQLQDVPFGEIFLPEGNFIVTENGPAGYALAGVEGEICEVADLQQGEISLFVFVGADFSECTINNELVAGQLTIAKVTDPSGGTDFPFTIDPGAYSFAFKWGSQGSGDSQFDNPLGVAVDAAGNVYVADTDNNRIQKFDSSGAFLFAFGWDVVDGGGTGFEVCLPGDTCKAGTLGSGDGQFNTPTGVAVDDAGNVYVADAFNSRIQKFDSSGAFLAKWGTYGGGNGQFNFPCSVAVDAAGSVYVADTANYRIQKFDSSGAFLFAFGWDVVDGGGTGFEVCLPGDTCKAGTLGSGDGQFGSARGVAVDTAGNVYVTDTLYQRIQKFDSSGVFLAKWGTNGTGDGQFNLPYGVAVDAAGHVYVADTGNNRIQKFDSSGALLAKWGTPGSGNGQFDKPEAVAVDAAGNVVVVDLGNQRIQVFNPSLATTLDDGESDSFDLPPGDYLVSELVPAAWVVSSIDCGDGLVTGQATTEVTLAAGDDVTCTFTNVQAEGPVVQLTESYTVSRVVEGQASGEGSRACYWVTLSEEPLGGDVVVNIGPPALGEVTVDKTQVTLDASNWDNQTTADRSNFVCIQAVDDTIDDGGAEVCRDGNTDMLGNGTLVPDAECGDHTDTVPHSIASSTASNYSTGSSFETKQPDGSFAPGDTLTILVQDNDDPGNCPAVAGNLVENYCFEDGPSPWRFFTNGAGSYTTSTTDPFQGNYAAEVQIDQEGSNVQLYQKGLALEPNTAYELSFAAYSTNGNDLRVVVHEDDDDFTNYGLNQKFNLGTGWSVYQTTFTTTNFNAPVNDARLRFWFAPFDVNNMTYRIDYVVLRKVDSGNPPIPPVLPPYVPGPGTCTPTPGNLIANPGYESGKTAWSFFSDGDGAFSTVTVDPYECRTNAKVSISQSGDNVQLYQKDISVQGGETYLLWLAARSSSGQDAKLYLHKHGSPYTNYGLNGVEIDLTPNWQVFVIEFTAVGSVPLNDARLRIWLAPYDLKGTDFEFDMVTLVPKSAVATPASALAASALSSEPLSLANAKKGPNPRLDVGTKPADVALYQGDFIDGDEVGRLSGSYVPDNGEAFCSRARPSRDTLQPANGHMARVNIVGLGSMKNVTITGIWQDGELGPVENARFEGGSAWLRQAHNEGETGRVYTIDFKAEYGDGQSCIGSVVVTVPEDRKTPAVFSGQRYDATSIFID